MAWPIASESMRRPGDLAPAHFGAAGFTQFEVPKSRTISGPSTGSRGERPNPRARDRGEPGYKPALLSAACQLPSRLVIVIALGSLPPEARAMAL